MRGRWHRSRRESRASTARRTAPERGGHVGYRMALEPIPRWRAWSDDVRGRALRAGHFFPEEAPERTAEALGSFLGGG